MDDLAIQLYRVDNPDGIWEYEDEAVRLHYRKRALEEETRRSSDRLRGPVVPDTALSRISRIPKMTSQTSSE